MKKIELYDGQFYIPYDEEVVSYRDEVLYGDGTHTCKELFEMKYKGIILKREIVKCDHPVFDYIEGDGEHTKEELIKIREEKLKPYLYNMFLSIWYETHGDNFED